MTHYMDSGWSVSRDGATGGPYTWIDLVKLARAGSIISTDQVWHESHGRWRPASEVEGLLPSAQDAPPAQSSSTAVPISVPPKSGSGRKLLWLVALLGVGIAVAAFLVLVGLPTGDSDPDTTATDDPYALVVEQGEGGQEVIDFQFSLERMTVSYVAAYGMTMQALGVDPTVTPEDEWDGMYTDAMAAWLRAEDMTAQFEASIDSYAWPSAGSSDSSSWPFELFTIESAHAQELDSFLSPDDVLMPDYDNGFIVQPGSSLTDDESEIGLELTDEHKQQLELEIMDGVYNGLEGPDKWRQLADIYGRSVQQVYSELQDHRAGLAQTYSDDATFYDYASTAGTAVSVASDVALLAMDTATIPGKFALVRVGWKYGLKGLSRYVTTAGARRVVTKTVIDTTRVVATHHDTILGWDQQYAYWFGSDEDHAQAAWMRERSQDVNSLVSIGSLFKKMQRGQPISEADMLSLTGLGNQVSRFAKDSDWVTTTYIDPATGLIHFADIPAGDSEVVEDVLSYDDMARLCFSHVPEAFEQDVSLAPYVQQVVPIGTPHAGSYEGSYELSFPGFGAIQIPVTMTIADDGSVTGDWSFSGPIPVPAVIEDQVTITYTTSGSIAASVDGDRLAGSATGTGSANTDTPIGPFASGGAGAYVIDGTVSDGRIDASLSYDGYSARLVAQRR